MPARLLRLSCVLSILAACAAPATRPMKFVAGETEAATPPPSTECMVRVRPIQDQRDNAGFGSPTNLDLFAQHLPEWVQSAVTTLVSANEKADSDPESLTMTVRIHKAYVQSLVTSRTTHIVLSNQYERGGRIIGTEYYRGSDTSVAWSNSADEIEVAMNTAMSAALTAMRKDIERYCHAR